jgi:hypothetical protein
MRRSLFELQRGIAAAVEDYHRREYRRDWRDHEPRPDDEAWRDDEAWPDED